MSATLEKFTRLKTLLLELFQLDQPELDFGLYRVMHARRHEIETFLGRDLLPQVQQAFASYQSADRVELQRTLAAAEAQVSALGLDPSAVPKVLTLREQLRGQSVDVGALETEVYDHLYRFFRRYYVDGDFLSRRVYKEGVYAIPYEGQEVMLHWANRDQYYIKTTEAFRTYAFRLRPDDATSPMRVRFELVDVAEGDHGNVKADASRERRFQLAPAGESGRDFVGLTDGELVIRFQYRPSAEKQDALAAAAVASVLTATGEDVAPWLRELGRPFVDASGKATDKTRLAGHLQRYVKRNTVDYFIHKDLGRFLRQELDFFIKTDVMHLDDVVSGSAPQLEQVLSKVRALRQIAHKIIDFLAQLEEFQKKLWLKKKFVVETFWCATLARIPEALYPEIAVNDAQRAEWVRLFAVDGLRGDLVTAGYSVPLTVDFLRAHPSLVLDTRHFDAGFTARLLASFPDLDAATDGLLVHSENFQALELLQARYRQQVKCVYIDPPYNTGNDGFIYRDSYQHGSWLSMAMDRLALCRPLMMPTSTLLVSLDENESSNLRLAVGESGLNVTHITNIVWQKVDSPNDNKVPLAPDHEYLLCFSPDPAARQLRPKVDPSILDAYRRDPETGELYRDRLLKKNGANSLRQDRPTMYFAIRAPDGHDAYPTHDDGSDACWSLGAPAVTRLQTEGGIIWKRRTINKIERWEPYTREHPPDQPVRPYPSIWLDVKTMRQAKAEISALFGGAQRFDTVKPTQLIERVLALTGTDGGLVLDFFAGSGTTGHAVLKANRQDDGHRKFILVEMADYFDTVLLPRIKKVTFSPEWDEGRPKRPATSEETARGPGLVKVIRLESYEDTLNNLQFTRSSAQQALFDRPDAQALREPYLLRYMLDVESRGSASLLDLGAFEDPTAYRLTVKPPGSDESRTVAVDLVETFNFLLGLRVRHLEAPETFSATLGRTAHGRLAVQGRLRLDPGGPWWFRSVVGTTLDDKRVLVIWRKLTGDAEADNAVLDAWFQAKQLSTRDREFDLVCVNGESTLENLRLPDEQWKVRRTESEFLRLMFDGEVARG